jgi:signal transduction histidine kinase
VNKYMHDRNQTRRLIIFLSLLIVAGFVATSLISYLVSRSTLRGQIITHELPLTSDNIYSEIQRDLLVPVSISSMMANDTFLQNWVVNGEKDVNKITQYLQTIQSKYHTFTSFLVSEKTGLYYQSKGILKTVKSTEKRDAWYFRVRKMKPSYEVNVEPDMANKYTMTIFINHKVYDCKGNFIGATGVGLKVSAVKSLIESYHNKYQRNIYFVSPEGQVVLSSSSIDSSTDNIKNIPGISSVASEVLVDKKHRFEYRRNGKTFFLNTRYIPELKWYLLVEQSADSATAGIFKTLVFNLILCGLVSIVVIIITSLALYAYQRKLQEMVKADFHLKLINKDQQQEIDKQNMELLENNKKLTQLNKSKDTLFSIISHDLRSPIGNISNLLEMLEGDLKENSNEEVKDIISRLKDISGSTMTLLGNLFDWAKSQISEVSYIPEEVIIEDLLRECRALQNEQSEKKSIGVSLNCEADLTVFADANMVNTIIRNLLSNAIKYTPENGKICIDAIRRGDEVAISVHDSGVGIDSNRISELFDFIQNKSTNGTQGERGTGLGLALCRDLAKLNNGEIQVISEVGTGSTFTLKLKATA